MSENNRGYTYTLFSSKHSTKTKLSCISYISYLVPYIMSFIPCPLYQFLHILFLYISCPTRLVLYVHPVLNISSFIICPIYLSFHILFDIPYPVIYIYNYK